ncbi:hypothetical protein MKX01_006013 [Papaver californicum]|nr:hypothetical protein MKX01_006013 [Papaver californicum]
METLEKEDLEENCSGNNILILEVTSPDQLNGDNYSKIMGVEKPGRIHGVVSGIGVTKLKGSSSSNVGKNTALRDEVKKLIEDHVIMQNNMQEKRLQMDKIVEEMKKANEESQEKNRCSISDTDYNNYRIMILLDISKVIYNHCKQLNH